MWSLRSPCCIAIKVLPGQPKEEVIECARPNLGGKGHLLGADSFVLPAASVPEDFDNHSLSDVNPF